MNLRGIFSTLLILATLLYLTILFFSLKKQDFHLAGKLALTVGLSSIPAALLCWLGIYLIELVHPENSGVGPFLVVSVVGFFLGTLFYAVWRSMPKIMSLFFTFGVYDSNQLLREYSQGISSVNNAEQLAQISIGLICQALKVQYGFLFEVFPEQESDKPVYHLAGMGGFGKDKPAELILDPKSPIFQYFQQTRQPLTQKDLDRLPNFQALSPEENSWLHNLSSEVFIPIHTRAEWIGMIALGPKVSNRPYSDEELTLITTLADQLSLALKNARLVDSLMRVNNDFRRAYQAMEQSNRHFQQALSQLQKIDQTKSDFISIASHELRTPVTIMRGYAEMLLEEPALAENDYHSKMLNGIHLGIMRLNEIIETMLDMASIDARALSLHKADVSLHYLIQSLTKPLQLTLEQRKITLTLEGLSDLPVIQADQEALRKVFNHLILNALQNTPDEGRIFISGLPISPGQAGLPEGGVEVIVSDTGIGIKREYLDLIFTKFYQTSDLQHHSTGKTKFKGSGPGLGLAIAKGIVEAHGGKIWAESPGYDEEKCPGSQFHALLPV